MDFENEIIEIEIEEQDECKTCMGAHDEEIHATTLRIRGWLRSRITRLLTFNEEFAAARQASPEKKAA